MSIAADLGIEAEGADLPCAPCHLEINAAQGLAIVPGHRAEPHVDIDILEFLLVLCLAGLTAEHGFHKVASVINFATHRQPQGAVAGTVDLERSLVAVGQGENRKTRRHEIT